jgi:putative flavoprotein involved in K+ transport
VTIDEIIFNDHGRIFDLAARIDQYIATHGLDAPAETMLPWRDGYDVEVITELDLCGAGITCVIWAIGYRFDFNWVRAPVFDGDGYPIQQRGVTAYPGLFFLGLPWLHTIKSGLLFGAGEDAAHIAAHIAAKQ